MHFYNKKKENIILIKNNYIRRARKGEESKNIKEYTVHQLNINMNKEEKKYGSKDIRLFKDEDIEDLIDEIGDYMIYVKNIAYYYDLYYNKHEKLNNSEMWLLLFSAEEIRKII